MPLNIFGMVSTRLSERYTIEALRTFFAHTQLGGNDEFVLIDNDASLAEEILRPFSGRITLVKNESAKSFAENANAVLRKGLEKEANVFLLNNDLIFSENWLEPLLVDKNILLSPVCNMQFEYGTGPFKLRLAMDMSDYVGNEDNFQAIVRAHKQIKRGYKLFHSVPFYCIKIPHRIYSDVGFFDEEFRPFYWEDVDYTLRCYLKGYPLYFALDSFILHFYGKSTWRSGDTPARASEEEVSEQVSCFERKWGKELAQIFGFQRPEALLQLRAYEEQAIIRSYGELIEKLRVKAK
jgi:GT2 family glycosyltransferase